MLYIAMWDKWYKEFKSGLYKRVDYIYKAVFHKIYLVRSWILCPKWSLSQKGFTAQTSQYRGVAWTP